MCRDFRFWMQGLGVGIRCSVPRKLTFKGSGLGLKGLGLRI